MGILSSEFGVRVLNLLSDRLGVQEDLYWSSDDGFFFTVHDVFAWGLSDGEDLTPENIHVLEQTLEDVERLGVADHYVAWLFAARVRELRPQGAIYSHMDERVRHLFDEAGPVRELGLGNPFPHPDEEDDV